MLRSMRADIWYALANAVLFEVKELLMQARFPAAVPKISLLCTFEDVDEHTRGLARVDCVGISSIEGLAHSSITITSAVPALSYRLCRANALYASTYS